MKAITLFMAAALVALAGCHVNGANYTHPAGYKPCSGPADCPGGTYCGFVAVDTYPVCKPR